VRSFAVVMGMIGFPVVLIALQPASDRASFFPAVRRGHVLRRYQTELWLIATLCSWSRCPWAGFSEAVSERAHQDFLDPARDPLGSGYQVMQAKIATGSGGITGKGFLHGYAGEPEYLPARHTDFIFSVLGENGASSASASCSRCICS